MGGNNYVKRNSKTDLTAGAQGKSVNTPPNLFVSKDNIRTQYEMTEKQKLQQEMLKEYGERGRKGVI